MPTITTAETLCGPRPSPHTSDFLRWVDEYISRRTRQCQVRRANVFYIDPSQGTNGSGTSASPWNSLVPVRSWLASNPAGNARFLFKRGTILRDTIGLTLTQPNLYFGAYGKNVATGGTDKPIISHFTVRWGSGGTRWVVQAGNRWRANTGTVSENPNLAGGSPASNFGFVRLFESPFNPLVAVGSSSECESTPYSFFSGSGFVDINLDGDNPNSYTIEAVPAQANPPDGFRILNGSTGLWIHGLVVEGWGCGALGLAATGGGNESGIRNLAGGTASEAEHVALITNCESYYNGAHAISQEPGGIGGTHIVVGCVAGFDYNGNNGDAMFNTYAGDAQQECVYKDCVARFGTLPRTITTPFPTVAQGSIVVRGGGAFYGHQGGSTHPVSLYLNIHCRIADERDKFPLATTYSDNWSFSEASDSMFAGTSASSPASIRAFVIGWKSPRHRAMGTFNNSSNLPPNGVAVARVIFVNSHFYCRRTWSVDFADLVFRNFQGIAINTIFELDDEFGDRTSLFTYLSVPTTGSRLINCMILVRGGMATNNADDQACIGDTGSQDRIRLANTLLMGVDRLMDPTNGIQISLARDTFGTAVKNNSDSLRYIAIAGCRLDDSAPYLGFSNATGLVQLESLNNTYPDLMNTINIGSGQGAQPTSTYTLDPASPLAGAGAAVPFADKSDMLPAPEYDFFGRRRPTVPSIGPFDVLNISTGGSGGGGGSLAMVRNPVRSTVSA